MRYFEFVVHLRGEGDDVDEAWQDATDAFAEDPGDYSEATEETEDGDPVTDGVKGDEIE